MSTKTKKSRDKGEKHILKQPKLSLKEKRKLKKEKKELMK